MKVRLRYTRDGKIRFTSHRDTARILERSLRKLRLPISYSEGFSPRPKLSFGLALSVGYESDAEYLDVDLATSVDLEDLPAALTDALPDGLRVVAAAELRPGTPSLQQAITSCRWQIEVGGATVDDVAAAVSTVLGADELVIERVRKGKTASVDVRPAILDLRVVGPTDAGVQLVADLATETVSLRPSELVGLVDHAVGGDDGEPTVTEGRVRRTHQFITVDDVSEEPLVAPEATTGSPGSSEPAPEAASQQPPGPTPTASPDDTAAPSAALREAS